MGEDRLAGETGAGACTALMIVLCRIAYIDSCKELKPATHEQPLTTFQAVYTEQCLDFVGMALLDASGRHNTLQQFGTIDLAMN